VLCLSNNLTANEVFIRVGPASTCVRRLYVCMHCTYVLSKYVHANAKSVTNIARPHGNVRIYVYIALRKFFGYRN
jgi:hypothetical protein